MIIESVIFDFDGIIVDTEPLHYKAFQKTLVPLELGFTWNEYCEIYMGYDDRDAFREAFKSKTRSLSTETLDHLISKKAEYFQKIISSGTTPYPGVIALVHHLHTSGVPLAICSGALRSDIHPILEQFSIKKYFSCIVTAEDVPHSKPDPRCYQIAWQQLQKLHPGKITTARKCLAIEDTPAGIESAKGAGLFVVAVTNSYPPEKLTQADVIIQTLEGFPMQLSDL